MAATVQMPQGFCGAPEPSLQLHDCSSLEVRVCQVRMVPNNLRGCFVLRLSPFLNNTEVCDTNVILAMLGMAADMLQGCLLQLANLVGIDNEHFFNLD